MGRTVKELLAALSSDELTDWLAYSRIEPWGDVRADYHAAMVALTMYQVMRGKDSPRLSLEDFLLEFGKGNEPETSENMKALLMGFTAQRGGKIEGAK